MKIYIFPILTLFCHEQVVREGEEPEEFWAIFNSFNTVYK